jgi:hypothetical protein
METVLLQILDSKAHKLIEDMESRNMVRVLEKSSQAKIKLSEKFAGALCLSDNEYKSFQDSIIRGRNEW